MEVIEQKSVKFKDNNNNKNNLIDGYNNTVLSNNQTDISTDDTTSTITTTIIATMKTSLSTLPYRPLPTQTSSNKRDKNVKYINNPRIVINDHNTGTGNNKLNNGLKQKQTFKWYPITTSLPPRLRDTTRNMRLSAGLLSSINAFRFYPERNKTHNLPSLKNVVKEMLTTKYLEPINSTLKYSLNSSLITSTTNTQLTFDNDLNSTRIDNKFIQNKCNCSRSFSAFADDYTNIWKFSFFVLAFMIAFVSIILILTFVFRCIITRLKKCNIFGFRKYRLQSGKSTQSSKVSSISLFEVDSDIYSLSDNKPTNSNDKSNKENKNFKRKPSIISIEFDKINLKKDRKNASKSSSLLPLNFSRKEKNKNNNNQRVIYGVTNKGFVETNPLKETKEYMMPCDLSNNPGIFYNIGKEESHSSFRPFGVKTPPKPNNAPPTQCFTITDATIDVACNASLPDIDLTSNNKLIHLKEVECIKRDNFEAYHTPWRQCNDYEALETTTGSITNLSSVTSFSEAISKQNSTFSHQFNCHKLDQTNGNNNELISRSNKITEELQLKLKERRLLMDNPDFSIEQKINNNENQEPTAKDKSLLWLQKNEKLNNSNNNASCSCHCHFDSVNCQNGNGHHHNHNDKNKFSNCLQSQNNNKQITTTTTQFTRYYEKYHKTHNHRQMVPSSPNEKSIDLPIETIETCVTPTKRDSIRKLMENRAVSKNKQKDELERHLSNMICSRMSSYEFNDDKYLS